MTQIWRIKIIWKGINKMEDKLIRLLQEELDMNYVEALTSYKLLQFANNDSYDMTLVIVDYICFCKADIAHEEYKSIFERWHF